MTSKPKFKDLQFYKRIVKVIFFKSVISPILIILLIFLALPVWEYYCQNQKILPTWYRVSTQLALGVWGGIFTSLLFAWIVYCLRFWIKREFDISSSINIRLPLMLGCAPFIIGKRYYLFEKNEIDINLDFRYAGISTLEDLEQGHCDMAVASDIAIINYLNRGWGVDFCTLPFVKIKNHIKVLTLDKSIKSASDLTGKKIAYVADSVHQDFLKDLNIKSEFLVEASRIIECYMLVVNNQADACVFWEPYYLTMENTFNLKEVELDIAYEWFLCLVAKDSYIDNNRKIGKSIYDSLVHSVARCKDAVNISENCITYMHPEFTGLNKEDLVSLLEDDERNSHHFQINVDMRKEFIKRLHSLGAKGYKYADNVEKNLWLQLKEEKKRLRK
jgi:hypothetical protein